MMGGEAVNDEMNAFMRSVRVINVEKQFFATSEKAYWCFCINYMDNNGGSPTSNNFQTGKTKVDYREVLDEKTFAVFARLREIRKQAADSASVPPFAVFTDAELAEIAKLDKITPENMLTIKGIGQAKVDKYASFFCENTAPSSDKNAPASNLETLNLISTK